MTPAKRKVDLAVISDLHLGMRGCRAHEVLAYLQSIDADVLVLNGDIIDIWQFKKKYFPPAHMRVVKELLKMMEQGKTIHYITGNHDELFRRFAGFRTGNFNIANKLVLELETGKAWIFHGDIFDVTMQHSKWLTKLGGKGYDMLIALNHAVNSISLVLGGNRISLSKKVKESVKGAVKYINQFEETAAEIAIDNGYDFVVCGHIHQPCDRMVQAKGGQVRYLNSGDWVENCTALEYHSGNWSIHTQAEVRRDETAEPVTKKDQEIFQELLSEFSIG